MGNHCIDCDYCGVDLRSYGHSPGCPGPAYEKARDEWWARRKRFIDAAVIPQVQALKDAEVDAGKQFDVANPPPPKPNK